MAALFESFGMRAPQGKGELRPGESGLSQVFLRAKIERNVAYNVG